MHYFNAQKFSNFIVLKRKGKIKGKKTKTKIRTKIWNK